MHYPALFVYIHALFCISAASGFPALQVLSEGVVAETDTFLSFCLLLVWISVRLISGTQPLPAASGMFLII